MNDCGAPWYENDDGECECPRCHNKRLKEAHVEYLIDNLDDRFGEINGADRRINP